MRLENGLSLLFLSSLLCSCSSQSTKNRDTSLSVSWPATQQNLAAIVLPSDKITEPTAKESRPTPAVEPVVVSKINIPKAKEVIPDEELAPSMPLIFDVPVSYNSKVQYWIKYFQGPGKTSFNKYLERSSRHLPLLKRTLRNEGLPQDLAYLSMIESGFSAHALSSANAVGPWQFIRETGQRYGLKITWWLDERRDFQKSTIAAAKYLKKMYGMFNNWYLVAAGYNTGEARVVKAIQKHQSHNFWKLSQNDFADETKEYVPKFIAALLIAKSPEMYGFRNINYHEPLSFEHFRVPGGTRLNDIADAIGVTRKHMADLNPELVQGFIPPHVSSHLIRVPKGSIQLVSYYVRKNFLTSR